MERWVDRRSERWKLGAAKGQAKESKAERKSEHSELRRFDGRGCEAGQDMRGDEAEPATQQIEH